MRIILSSIALLFTLTIGAQEVEQTLVESLQERREDEGIITIHDEDGVEELVNIQVAVNKRMGGVDGYRIQLFSGTGPRGKKNALGVKGKFLNSFPDHEVDLSFTSPFWRVRVGNYRHKHEALPLLSEVKRLFPNSYIVKDGTVKMSKF